MPDLFTFQRDNHTGSYLELITTYRDTLPYVRIYDVDETLFSSGTGNLPLFSPPQRYADIFSDIFASSGSNDLLDQFLQVQSQARFVDSIEEPSGIGTYIRIELVNSLGSAAAKLSNAADDPNFSHAVFDTRIYNMNEGSGDADPDTGETHDGFLLGQGDAVVRVATTLALSDDQVRQLAQSGIDLQPVAQVIGSSGLLQPVYDILSIPDSVFEDQGYLRLVVDEIVVTEETVLVRGSKSALEHAVFAGTDAREGVLTSIQEWRARQDSNLRPQA